MRASLLTGLSLLVLIAGCESDAKRLERLQRAEGVACLPVMLADSTRRARDMAAARLKADAYSSGVSSIPEREADLDVVRRAMANMQRDMQHPDSMAIRAESLHAARTRCELAKRDLNRFMQGSK